MVYHIIWSLAEYYPRQGTLRYQAPSIPHSLTHGAVRHSVDIRREIASHLTTILEATNRATVSVPLLELLNLLLSNITADRDPGLANSLAGCLSLLAPNLPSVAIVVAEIMQRFHAGGLRELRKLAERVRILPPDLSCVREFRDMLRTLEHEVKL